MSAYTLVIGNRDWSSWSLRPFLALSAADVPFETVLVRLRLPESKAEILRHSPSGKVPALKIAEMGGILTIWDSLAICETIAERHPEAGLWPGDAAVRAKARASAAEMHSGFPDIRDQLSMDYARRHPAPELREETRRQIARILEAWSEGLEEQGGEFLFGRFSIADCMYAPVVSRFVTYDIAVPARVKTYMDRMMALPAMRVWGAAAQREVDDGIS